MNRRREQRTRKERTNGENREESKLPRKHMGKIARLRSEEADTKTVTEIPWAPVHRGQCHPRTKLAQAICQKESSFSRVVNLTGPQLDKGRSEFKTNS